MSCYYRDRHDFILHLAVGIAEFSNSELAIKRSSNEICDVNKAPEADLQEARAILKRAGIRTPDESPPAWHFTKAALQRGAAEDQA